MGKDITSIADSREEEQVLKGIQPKRQLAYRIFKFSRTATIAFGSLALVLFICTFVSTFSMITRQPFFRAGILILAGNALLFLIVALLVRFLLLRKCPFDDWVFEVAQKSLGTQVIFYTAHSLYIQYDIATSKEVDKKDFVTKMSDLSEHYSYFYIDTDIDQQVIIVECTRKQPIPETASMFREDDKHWNIVPLGVTTNDETKSVSNIGWWLNENNKDKEMVKTIASTSCLVAGGTGCLKSQTPVPLYNTLVKEDGMDE